MNVKCALFTAVSAALLASTAMAAPGFYVYGGAGYSKADTDLTNETYADQAGNAAALEVDEKSFGLKLAAGYRFNDYFAVEGSYAYLGKAKAELGVYLADYDIVGAASASMKAHVFAVDAVGLYPVTKTVDVFAKAGLGVGFVKTKASLAVEGYGSESLFSESDTRVVPKLGIGAEWKVTDKVAIRAEYERYFGVSKDSDYSIDADYDVLSVGVKYAF